MAEEKSKFSEHWWVVILVVVVVVIFLVSLVTFQVQQNEYAVVLRFGEPHRKVEPGLAFKWPWPIESTWVRDSRIRILEAERGAVEEVLTKGGRNVVVTTYVAWRIAPDADALTKFLTGVDDFAAAEERLTALMRSHRITVIGQYEFSELVNLDADKVKLEELEDAFLRRMRNDALDLYGIEVVGVGLKHLGLPQDALQKVSERMIAERERKRQEFLSQGKAEAERIRSEAESEAKQILADARREAKLKRAEAEAEAQDYYAVFQKDPKLAQFLQEIDALRALADNDKLPMTLVVGPEIRPFNLLREDALKQFDFDAVKPAADEVASPQP